MADIRAGGAVIRPSTGATVRWTPIEPVADEFDAVQMLKAQGYSCLGVIGNAAHLLRSGGHTPWCSEGYGGRACRVGRVYAIDLDLPDPAGTFLGWLRSRLQAGYYGWVYYLNWRNKQLTRVDGFRGTYYSSDHHLHLSGLAGHENDNSSILRDWEAARTRPVVRPTATGSAPVIPREDHGMRNARLYSVKGSPLVFLLQGAALRLVLNAQLLADVQVLIKEDGGNPDIRPLGSVQVLLQVGVPDPDARAALITAGLLPHPVGA